MRTGSARLPRGISRSVIGGLSTISAARRACGLTGQRVGAQLVVLGVRGLALLGPCPRELRAALGLEARTEVAAVAHLIEYGDRLVDAADREQRTASRVLERGHVGAERGRFVGEGERRMRVRLPERDARAV